MEIFLPKSETGGGSDGDKEHWEAKAHASSESAKNQIIAFEEYFSRLSKRTKEIDDELNKARETILVAEENAKKTLKISEDTRALVIFGFFVLLFMVAGLVFAYWEFTYSANRETQSQLIENKFKSLDLENNYQILEENNKNLLKIIDCQKFKKYWQYEECFK
jgi:hypothetical protein